MVMDTNFATVGQGAISSNTVLLQTSSFQSNPPTFTLRGMTRGGPPTTYTWMRNGEVITDGGPYSISIAVTLMYNLQTRINASYTSTLVVTGTFPGVYKYTVSNRAMTISTLTNCIDIEGRF